MPWISRFGVLFSAVGILQARNAAVSPLAAHERAALPAAASLGPSNRHRQLGSWPQGAGLEMLFNRHRAIARRQRRGYNTAHVANHTQPAADANYVPGRPSTPLRVSGTFPVRTRVVSACHQTAFP